MTISMRLVRCVACGTTLFSQGIFNGAIEIKCRKNNCKTINQIYINKGVIKTKVKNDTRLAEHSYIVLN